MPDQFTSYDANEHVDNAAQAAHFTSTATGATPSAASASTADLPPPHAPPDVFRTPNGRFFAVVDGRTMAVESREFKDIVKYEILGDAPEVEVRRYMHALKALARSKSMEELFVRTARTANAVYIDLANAAGDVVTITAGGWNITSKPPVRFLRPSGTAPLVCPQRGGSYRDLQRFIRLGDPAFCLLIAHLTYIFQHAGPQPIALFVGEQGSAKSTATRQVCRLLDPRAPELRRPPGSNRDLMIAAARAWLIVYDNVSELKPWLSDSLCVLSTGGGFGTRKNHSDTDETTFDLRRPVLMNGIEDFVRRDDLRDRCIVYELDPIPPTERRDETTLFGEFSKDLPGILGSLFDLCSGALAHGEVSAAALPRMADFFKWALAVEAAAGWSPGTIERAYAEQRQAADAGAMEEPLVAALAKFVAAQGRWSGTSTELLAVLEPFAPVRERGSKWPDGPPRLGGELRRLAPLLRRGGVAVSFLRSGLLRRIVLAHSTDDSTSVPSLPSLPEAAASTVGGRYPDAGDGQRVGGAVASATVPRSGAESEDELRGRAAIPNLASETNNSPAVPSPASPPSPVAASQAFVPMIAAEPDQPSAVASPPLRPSSNSARAEPGGRNDGSGAGDGSVGDQAHLVAVPRISREPNNPDLLSLTSPASLPDAPASTIGSLDTVEGEDERKSAPEEEDLNAQASVTDGVNCDNPSNSIVAEIGCALGDGDDSNDGSAGRLQDGASELTALSSTAIAPGAATAAASDTVVGTGKVPPRWRTIQQVLRGKKMNAAEVVEALRAVNAMPKVKDPVAYIRQELAYGAKKSHFIVVDRGIYTW